MVAPLRRASGRPGRCMQRPDPAREPAPHVRSVARPLPAAHAALRPPCWLSQQRAEAEAPPRGRAARAPGGVGSRTRSHGWRPRCGRRWCCRRAGWRAAPRAAPGTPGSRGWSAGAARTDSAPAPAPCTWRAPAARARAPSRQARGAARARRRCCAFRGATARQRRPRACSMPGSDTACPARPGDALRRRPRGRARAARTAKRSRCLASLEMWMRKGTMEGCRCMSRTTKLSVRCTPSTTRLSRRASHAATSRSSVSTTRPLCAL